MGVNDIQVSSEQQTSADDALNPYQLEKNPTVNHEQQQPLQYEDDFSSSSSSSLSLEDKSSTEEVKVNEQTESVPWQRDAKILDYPEHSESPQSTLAVSATRPSASRLMQASSQQKRTSKRIRRSSDHHKRAAVSNHNRKVHANNNKQPTTPAPKSPIKQQPQHNNDRVVRTDEIALFMRCKKRYSDPDFKPIPPVPGGWDEVTPDRVIEWEQTANIITDFSSYNQPNNDWNAVLPWIRDDDGKSPAAVAGTDSNKPSHDHDTCSSRKSRQDSWKPVLSEKSIATSYPPPITSPLNHGKRQESLTTSTHVKSNNIRTTRAFPDRFLNQPSLVKSANQLFEQRAPALWDIGTRPYHRRSSTYSLDIQTSNVSLAPISAPTRRFSYGHDNTNRSHDPLIGSCSPWSPNPPDWSMYRVPPYQQEWTPPTSPWSPDRKRSSYFSSSLFSPNTTSESNSMSVWEERCASILKVVEDDTSKDDVWTAFPPPKDTQRRSSYNDINWNRNTTNNDGMALLVANSQLLQNMVQTGHMGCRHCGSGAHSIARNCPYLPTLSIQDAWLQLLQAANRRDTELFMDAIDIYSKSQPNETLPSIARRLQDAQSTLQLVALDKTVPSTTVLVDLQGRMRRKYAVMAMALPSDFFVTDRGHAYDRTLGMPGSAEQNMSRLAEAGFARDLTEMAHCMLCKQSGHWAKDCTARKPQHQPPRHDYLPRRKQFPMTDPTLSSKDSTAELSHRLYYSLNEYVLVDGI
ncbi:hypothetical protein BJV82DRAFT_606479 [Fennellomyces sp. T-0311]|nr:hypothetical protein BJV82DRAFT_606479 [Fennellomyces sp. T-0311]